MTSEIVINEGAARRITERICILLDSVAGQMDRLAHAVQDAYAKRVDQVLGYDSWADYAEHEFGPHTTNLAAPIRRELVSHLSEAGMSTRAIAPAVGKDFSTISRDRSKVLHNATPDSESSDYSVAAPDFEDDTKLSPIVTVEHHDIVEPVDVDTGEILEEPEPSAEPEPKPVTGLDGKTYQRSMPAKPRRNPITDQFTHRTVELTRLVDSFTRLIEDDRFDTNKQNIAATNGSDIKRAVDALSQVFDALNKE
ncbi:helix-turn-helix domain-containing protein [Bifidobacterium mongoliense]|uniref:helix-turn-helix domain-containing protein n=1 Tax=Bifidobacterium mongoliense TaxID=518643 RepID=UPI0026493351|nr:helix-turn-helix domain-containing protein [Bifidobacterium mongoliense]MDN5980004.1 helix-turn-helix domain-containing protein [Bifidobacterium mongoliense]